VGQVRSIHLLRPEIVTNMAAANIADDSRGDGWLSPLAVDWLTRGKPTVVRSSMHTR
jgi:hypothetical protein